MTPTVQMPPLDLRAEVATVDDKNRTVELTFASANSDVLRFDWDSGRRFYERLSLDPKHVRMERLQSGAAPLLDSHSGYSLTNVIGVVESASIDAKRGTASVRFSKRAEVEPFFQDVKDKIIRNVSVGYRVHRFEELADMRDGMTVRLAVDWEPFEISMVPIGADAGARTRGAGTVETNPCVIVPITREQQRTNEMEPETKTDDVATRAVELERRRVSEVNDLLRVSQLDSGTCSTIAARGLSVEAARAAVFQALVARDNATPMTSHVRIGGEERAATRVALMSEALCGRFGGPAPSNDAREFTHMRVVDMARSCLAERGVNMTMMPGHTIVQRALHTSSDFAELLTGAGNRTLRYGYDSYQGGVLRICKKSTAPDFRAKSKLMLGEAPQLLQVSEHGEVTRGTMAESKQSYSLATYARIFGITRQALVNDDLGAFMDMSARLGRAAAEFVAAQLSAKLAGNPVLADNVALFHADHDNLGTTGAISITTLTEALKMMRLQTGLDGTTVIDVTPKFLVVPAAKEVLARQFVAQINATAATDVNPFSAQLEVVVDPRLDAYSATAWYLSADPNAIDTIEYSYLEGDEGPVLESRAGFDVEGVEMKVRLDFGCGVIDHRGLFKNAGA